MSSRAMSAPLRRHCAATAVSTAARWPAFCQAHQQNEPKETQRNELDIPPQERVVSFAKQGENMCVARVRQCEVYFESVKKSTLVREACERREGRSLCVK